MTETGSAPKVSFIMPAYNAAATVLEALASITAQTVGDWEAVVVDDGSRDDTFAVLTEAARSEPRLRVFRQANGGASAARNRALAEARGTLAAFLDADDWIAPDFLERLLPLADEGRAIAYCAYRRILPSGRQSPIDWCPELEEDPVGVLAKRCEPAIHCVLVSRALILSLGSFDTSLRTCEDWDLWLRLARTGIPFRGTPEALASYRMRPFSLSTHKAGSNDAEVVMQRARMPDPRIAEPDPRHARGWDDAPEIGLREALARQALRVAAGQQPERGWLAAALGEHLVDLLQGDPAQLAIQIDEAAQVAGVAEQDRAFALLLQDLRHADPWLAKSVNDWRDMLRARRNCATGVAREGRWLAYALDRTTLPALIEPPAGCDALLLVATLRDGSTRDLALPLTRPLPGSEAYAAVFENWGLVELLHVLPARRYGRFAIELLRRLPGAASRLLRPATRREAGILAFRQAIARTLGTPEPAAAADEEQREVPVVLFDRIVSGRTRLASDDIGKAQLGPLLHLLADEGYHAVGFADLAAARRKVADLPPNPLVLVFADCASLLDEDVLDLLPEPLTRAEVLFTPEEIARELPAAICRPGSGGRMSPVLTAGLRVDRLPQGSAAAITRLGNLREALLEQECMADAEALPAYCTTPGLDRSLLKAAGFKVVLSPGTGHVRLGRDTCFVPTLECRGAEAVGDILENLRQAA